ncbi:MAG: type VI secretion system membrane subunit TssM [Pseudomonadota bacterium]
MRFLKAIFGFLFSRRLWIFLSLVLLCVLIWIFSPQIKFGETEVFASPVTRLVIIGLITIAWLVSLLFAVIRAIRANQVFIREVAHAEPDPEPDVGDENIATINRKFQGILAEMQQNKLGRRKFLREMPWYVIIGPPGTGKTTALKQSGLEFPIDLVDDLKGVGGTRNCDWFLTEDAVMIDTAGRYVEQESDPEVDSTEWFGFLRMLKKHRGIRALNGVVVALSVQELFESPERLRFHGRQIRRRLSELQSELGLRLPVYLLITKLDLIPGFEAFFGNLNTRAREQVWGATLDVAETPDETVITSEFKALVQILERQLTNRITAADRAPEAAEIFRFPSRFQNLAKPLRDLVDAIFSRSRFEDGAWLRGFYFSSATQEGSPIDALVSDLSTEYGLSINLPRAPAREDRRSFFLKEVLSEVMFGEAGLVSYDPRQELKRKWIWRGALSGAVLTASIAVLVFFASYLGHSGAIAKLSDEMKDLNGRFTAADVRPPAVERPELHLALEAVQAADPERQLVSPSVVMSFGPSAASEIEIARTVTYENALKNILEPRMVALLEATMWQEIRDPEFMLDALKVYRMLTGSAPLNVEFVATWWTTEFDARVPINLVPFERAVEHQVAAVRRLETDGNRIEADEYLLAKAVESICSVPLSVRAYRAMLANDAITALPEWVPADVSGPNGMKIFERRSNQSLRVGLPGAYTYKGFHESILPLVPEVAARAELDRMAFEGGCGDSRTTSGRLQVDILKLYYEDYIAQWDGVLRDIVLKRHTDIRATAESLKDLASADSALKRLLTSVVNETYLTRPKPEADEGSGFPGRKLLKKAAGKLGRVGKLIKKGSKFAGRKGGGKEEEAIPGEYVSLHFASLRKMVEEVDGSPPLIDEAVAALGALNNELQIVLAQPSPEKAILERGGMANLTQQVVNVAPSLPDPIDDWVANIGQDAGAATQDTVISQLNARWRADVYPFCVNAIGGRYPFTENSVVDVNVADFQRLFGPGGLIDTFTNEQLAPYLDTTKKPWAWRADYGLGRVPLASLQKARDIRDSLFAGGAGPLLSFHLEPTDMEGAIRSTLNVDGNVLAYSNAAARPVPMTWPGKDGTNLVSLSFTPTDNSPEVILTDNGAWAWLRMVRKGKLQRTNRSDLFRLSLGETPYWVHYHLIAASVENPFDLSMFRGFKCVERF